MSTLDITDAALLLKVHPKTLQNLARRGLVPSCKVGRAWVFMESLLLDYLRARSVARYVETPIEEDAKCPSTSAKTRPIGGSSFRPSAASRSFATWHRQAGTPTHELQRLGGWKTGAMVERYAHVAPDALQGAASRLDAFGGYAAATPKEKGASN